MKTTKMLSILVLALGLAAKVANADFTFGTPVNLGTTVNSSAADRMPSVSADSLSLYFSSYRPGGHGGDDIWVTRRATIDDDWGSPENLAPRINTPSNDSHPSISLDGLMLFFSSNRPGGYGDDIWVTTRSATSEPWSEPINLGPTVNSSSRDLGPCISADGLELFFHSNRSGGYNDILVTTRTTTSDPWSEPVNLGPGFNGPVADGGPDISADGLMLFFRSYRQGSYDIWFSKRATVNDDWDMPVHLGPPVNTSEADSMPNVSADGSILYFQSNRAGGLGGYDLWQVPIIPIVDFNGDGIVDSADMCIIVDYWGTDEPLCDIGPMPWGDGIVDVQDLIVLAEHLFEDYRLIGHWKLDETEGDIAYDSAGNNHGTLNGDPQWVSGFIDGALEFDGVDDYVEIGDLDLTGSFTLTCWIRPSSLPGGWYSVVIKEDDYGIEFNGSTLEGGTWPNGWHGYVSTPISTPAIWYHAALTWNGSDVEMFIDGSSVGQNTGSHASNNKPLLFGSWDTSSEFFHGIIDDVRIYNVALSAEEIEALVQ